MSVNERLKLIRSAYNESQAKFCKRFNIPQQTYANYELGGRSIPESLMINLRTNFNINLNWLITGEGNMYLEEQPEGIVVRPGTSTDDGIMDPVQIQRDVPGRDPDIYLVPITNLQLSAGNGALWPSDETYMDKVLPIPRRLASKFGDLVAAVVWGDSMEPTLKNGEPVAFLKDTPFDFDGLYVISWHGEIYIKRLARFGNALQIISDNPKYPTKEIDIQEESDFTVLGKVVFWMHIEK